MQSSPQPIHPGARASAPKQSPILYYALLLAYVLLALVLRLIAVAPLCALFVFPAGSALRWLALLCPALLLFVVLPLRFSFAQALVQPSGRRSFSLGAAFSFDGYWEKLGDGIWHALHVFAWSLPLLAVLAYGYYFKDSRDGFTLLSDIRNLGASVTSIGCAMFNFFSALFGGAVLTPTGGLMEGFYTLFAIVGLCALIWLYGSMRNSAFRYIWATATREERNARVETRRCLRGRRVRQLAAALLNLVLWIPFVYVLARIARHAFGDLTTMISSALVTQTFDTAALTSLLTPALIAYLTLYLTLLPIRRLITARFAASCHPGARASRRAAAPAKAGRAESSGADWMKDVPTTSSGSPAPQAESESAQTRQPKA